MKIILILTLCLLLINCNNKTINQNASTQDYDTPVFEKGKALTGARSSASIMKRLTANLASIQKLYIEEYKGNYPDNLRIVVFFKINYLGIVITSEVLESDSNNPNFDSSILNIINAINFDHVYMKDDITEVTYPFVFRK